MAGHPLDEFLTSSVQPLLQDRGYRKRRRTFRWLAPNGDYSVIAFSTRAGHPDWPSFCAEFGYVVHKPRPYLPPDLQTEIAKNPPFYKGQLRLRIAAPPSCAPDDPLAPYEAAWRLPAAGQPEPVTSTLLDILRDQLLPIVERIVAGERNAYELADPNLRTVTAVGPFQLLGAHLHTPIYGDRDWLARDQEPG